ncbi:hypothetical protein [Pandoraea sp. ISTKB]|uniref:hypothetical protein n=1 Tax=Pandoraea sp. ISTKB TaxID=1586708 RepID=UPI00084770BA|nr:hypothetical protein [Pandoraea sp. ISTKB]ODP33074.1 hypothetical protein A9762_20740 [Pandoraea sp. ISTKB]
MSKPQQQQPAFGQSDKSEIAGATSGVTFRDKAFKSRVIVFPGGATVTVERGTATVTDAAHIEALDKRDDFERVSE